MFTDASALKDIVAVLAPGFIILMFQDAYRVGPKQDFQTRLFAYAVASTVYFAAVAAFVRTAIDHFDRPTPWAQGLEYGLVPMVLGVLVALVRTLRWLDGISRVLRLPPIHHIPSAWDWVFFRETTAWHLRHRKVQER